MSPRIDKVTSNEALPKEADAVVIGAGIIGIATALELRARGLSVVVVEKGEVAAEQSSRNWGWCRIMGRDPREVPLMKVSLHEWSRMNERVGAETGFRTCGIAYLSADEKEMANRERWLRNVAKPNGIASELLTADQVAKVIPGSTLSWVGALFTPGDCRAEPFLAVPAMARGLQKLGGMVFQNCAARGLETAAGKVASVVTERRAIKTRLVILAGGYWTDRFLDNLGLSLPQLGVISSVMRTSPVDAGFTHTFSGRNFTARKRLDGGYTVTHNVYATVELTPAHLKYFKQFLPLLKYEWRGMQFRLGRRFIEQARLKRRWQLDQMSPFEVIRVLDPEPAHHLLDEAECDLKACFPAFAPFKSIERWGGMIDATPDAVPVIDRVEMIPGLHLASGFSGHGFGIGPGAGKLMADIALGEKPCVDPSPFRFSRFSDGTPTRPESGV